MPRLPLPFAPAPVLLALLLAAFVVPDPAAGQARGKDHAAHGGSAAAQQQHRHPAPRPGITGERVLPAHSVPEGAREAYTIAARIPGVLDGIYCPCDCHERDGLRSLLECFENQMASTCGLCTAAAKLAEQMHGQGRPLRDIRKAIDSSYGG